MSEPEQANPSLPSEQLKSSPVAELGNSEPLMSADALFEQGMAHYRRREWLQAREVFNRLKALQPDRRGLDALLDEIDIFLRLQALEPGSAAENEEAAEAGPREGTGAGRFVTTARQRRKSMWPWALGAASVVIIAALVTTLLVTRWSRQNEAEGLWNLAQAYFNSGNYAKSIETLDKLLAIGPTPYDIEAKALREVAGEQRKVRQHYERAKELSEQEQWQAASEALEAFRGICERLGNRLDPDLRRACQEAPEQVAALARKAELSKLYTQGKALYASQNWGLAADAFEKLQGLDAEYKKREVRGYLFASYLNYGERLVEVDGKAVDQVERAIEIFDKAKAIQPDDQRVAEEASLARTYLAALQAFHASAWETARSQLQNLYQQKPGYAGGRVAELLCITHLRLGDAAYEKDELETALAHYRQVLEMQECNHAEAEVKEIKVLGTLFPPTATPTVTSTPTPTPTSTPTRPPTNTPLPTNTPRPPTNTPLPTNTPRPPTSTPVPPTKTPVPPPTNTPAPPPPTNTPAPPPTDTPKPRG